MDEIRNLLRYGIRPYVCMESIRRKDTRCRVMPYACGNAIHDCVVIPCQSFGLDRKKQVFRLAFFLAPRTGLEPLRIRFSSVSPRFPSFCLYYVRKTEISQMCEKVMRTSLHRRIVVGYRLGTLGSADSLLRAVSLRQKPSFRRFLPCYDLAIERAIAVAIAPTSQCEIKRTTVTMMSPV